MEAFNLYWEVLHFILFEGNSILKASLLVSSCRPTRVSLGGIPGFSNEAIDRLVPYLANLVAVLRQNLNMCLPSKYKPNAQCHLTSVVLRSLILKLRMNIKRKPINLLCGLIGVQTRSSSSAIPCVNKPLPTLPGKRFSSSICLD